MDFFDFNKRVKNAKSSPIRQFSEKISSIEDILMLTLGQPDFHAPELVHAEAIKTINDKKDAYTSSNGLAELREAISSYVKRRYNLTYDAEKEILVTHGATGALFSSLFALLNPGDKVLVPSPYYPVYKTQIEMAQAEIVLADVSDTDFILTGERFLKYYEANPEIKVVLLNYPSNPTGVTYSKEALKNLADVIAQKDVVVISDEIYAELTYGAPHTSIASYLFDQTIVINGLSKSHAMTGWRMGFITGPELFINEIAKVSQATINTPNTMAQYASIMAYGEENDAVVKQMKAEYKNRRDYLIEELHKLGYSTSDPAGAFYLFIKVPDWYTASDEAFCLALAHEAKIGVIPGSAFGEAGNGYFRLSYAASQEDLTEFIKRIKRFTEEKQ